MLGTTIRNILKNERQQKFARSCPEQQFAKKKLFERTIAKDYSEEWFVKLANKKIHKDISKIDTYQEDECKNRFAQ